MPEALALMQEATQNMMVDQATPAMHKITMGYNLARLQEASGAGLAACTVDAVHCGFSWWRRRR